MLGGRPAGDTGKRDGALSIKRRLLGRIEQDQAGIRGFDRCRPLRGSARRVTGDMDRRVPPLDPVYGVKDGSLYDPATRW